MMQKITIIFLLIINIVFIKQAKAEKDLGIWITREQYKTKESLRAFIDTVGKRGFNLILINVWCGGVTTYPSEVMLRETGIGIEKNLKGRDVLSEAIEEGHKRGMKVYAWLEYGFSAGYKEQYPLLKKHPDWGVRTKTGELLEVDGGHKWMKPYKKEVQNFLIELSKEIIQKYKVDGIELDRIRISHEINDEEEVKRDFQTEKGEKAETGKIHFWQIKKINEFVERYSQELRQEKKEVKIAQTVGNIRNNYFSSIKDGQDWLLWLERGWVDEVDLQCFTKFPESYKKTLAYVKEKSKGKKGKIKVGVSVIVYGEEMQEEYIKECQKEASEQGFGTIIWHSGSYKKLIEIKVSEENKR